MRQRAYTSAIDDLSSSSRFSGSGKQLRRHLGSARGTLRSRFSTGAAEVEDGSSRESSRCVSFMDPPVKSSSPAQTVTICAPPSEPAPLPPPHRTADSPPPPVPRHLNYHRTNALPFINSPPLEPAPPPPKPLRITAHTQTPGPTYEKLCPPGGNYCELVRRPTSCPDYCAPWDSGRGGGAQTLFARPESDLDVLPDSEGWKVNE